MSSSIGSGSSGVTQTPQSYILSFSTDRNDSGRINVKLQGDFGVLGYTNEAKMEGVKKYNAFFGRILAFFGFACKVQGELKTSDSETGNYHYDQTEFYVNKRSLFKHLAEKCTSNPKDEETVKQIAEDIEDNFNNDEDEFPDKSVVVANAVVALFHDHNERKGISEYSELNPELTHRKHTDIDRIQQTPFDSIKDEDL